MLPQDQNNLVFRLEVAPRENVKDAPGDLLAERINGFLRIPVTKCRLVCVFTVVGLSREQVEKLVEDNIWHDPISQRAAIGPLPCLEPLPDWICEVSFRPGVTDNEANIAKETAALALETGNFEVYTSTQYRLSIDGDSSREQIEIICRDLLCNDVIQRYRIKSFREWAKDGGFRAKAPTVAVKSSPGVAAYDLFSMSDAQLEELSKSHTWALSLAEMHAIRNWFRKPEVIASRREARLGENPTDVEMETLAQTWSEHCKHKIFSARVNYLDENSCRRQVIDNLYKTCIRDATAIIRKRAGKNDYCHSVFKDNAGVIAFINGYDVCIKVETHNSPSALDPYGGALTGIVGVNRDPLGTGMGADLICNIDVFCFASPKYDGQLPPRILHPRRIMEGVRQGVEDGGNKSGIPTVNGSIVFDDRYLGKPLVFCGTIGLLPAEVCGHPGYEKKAMAGDFIVMAGGRIGKDGIHGATFSSEELNINSPATAVQIGDPITQRKLYDFILRARDNCLYHSITDNGAGGLSSSVGEMAEDTGGCVLELANAPLKYAGLRPWEILLSEAQERMTFAVPPSSLQRFLALARQMGVEATALGNFTDSGFFEVRYKNDPVARLGMDFLHHGLPQLKLNAKWREPQFTEIDFSTPGSANPQWQSDFLKSMLGRFNICSKEKIIRQYDHEVRGGSAIKPLAGIMRDGPTDGAVLRPLLESDAGICIAHGICPKFSDYDTYWMMANAIDEAIRNAVAVGANPDALAGVDNFCWCDPVQSPRNPDGEYKMAQLVRACRALRQFCLAFGIPCISGKDSMKNDYLGDSGRISIPPTVLFTAMGVIGNVTQAQSSDFKRPGDQIFLLGGVWKELGASEAAAQLGLRGGKIPRVDAPGALTRYRALHGLMAQRAISACHDCSDGGFAVALAEMCIGARLGCRVNLDSVRALEKMNSFEMLYSESASRHIVSVRPDLAPLLETLGMWQICTHIGEVNDTCEMAIQTGDSIILTANVEELAVAFKSTFDQLV